MERRISDVRFAAFLRAMGIEPLRVEPVKCGSNYQVVFEYAVTDDFNFLHNKFFSDAPVGVSPFKLLRHYCDLTHRVREIKTARQAMNVKVMSDTENA